MSKIDYESMLHGKKPQDQPKSLKWWNLTDASDIANSIHATTKYLYDRQSRRQSQLIMSARLYGNLSLSGIAGLSYSKIASTASPSSPRVTYNVAQSVVDTITAKMAKNKPKPYFLSSGGDYRIKRKAIKLGKFIDGCFYECELYKHGIDIFRDAAVWGDGVLHVYSHNGKIKVERVPIAELYVDELEGFYRKPRQMYRVKNVDRQVLIELFPKHKAEIMAASMVPTDSASSSLQNVVSDQVSVIEAWHLPSGEEASDGKHVISLDNLTLFQEQYTRHHFPFAIFSWSKRMYGFYAQGLVEQIQNIQTEINKLLWVIQRSMHLSGSFKILIRNDSKIVKEQFNNELGNIIMYAGDVPPQYITPPIIAPEMYSHLMTLKNSAFEQAGISQLSAQSKKPDGLNSGKAIREYHDIESDRFQVVGQAYEEFYLDVAKLMIEEAKEIYSEDKKFTVKVPGKKFIQTIPWKEVDMPDDQYVMQVYPVSKLPDDPSGRLQTITEYMQANLITPQAGRRLLDYPDLEAENTLADANEDLLHNALESIVEKGEYVAPEPTDDLQLALKLVLEYIALGRLENLESEKMEQLRVFRDQVQLLTMKATQPAPNTNPAPANPTQTPQSELLPNVNSPAVS